MEYVRGQGIQLLRQARQFVRSITRERYVDEAIRDVPDWRHVNPEDDELAKAEVTVRLVKMEDGMGRRVVNLIVCVVAFPFVYAAASLLRFAWAAAFVNDRSFTEYLGFIAGNTLLTWAFYFLFFFVVGVGVAALLRTNRPLVWAACFGIAYSLFRLIAGTNHIIVPSTGLYVSIAGEYVMPVVGCMVGALLGSKLRGNGPSGSRAPDPISGST